MQLHVGILNIYNYIYKDMYVHNKCIVLNDYFKCKYIC